MNATIDIPILSSFYKKISGDPFSLLDLGCLVTAIPLTVAYKVIAGAAPFPDDATTTALAAAPDFASFQAICNGTSALASRQTSRLVGSAAIAPSINKKFGLSAGIVAWAGAGVQSIVAPLKKKFPALPGLSPVNSVAYLLYVTPDLVGQIPDLQHKKWWAVFNNVVADLMLIKTVSDACIDKSGAITQARKDSWNAVSPWVDCVGNVIWEVPTTAAFVDPENRNTPGLLAVVGGSAFDCNGILSPLIADDSDPVTWTIVLIVATLFNDCYGVLSCASAALLFQE